VPDGWIGCGATGVAQQAVTGPAQTTLLGALVKLAPGNASQAGRSVVFAPALDVADSCTELAGVTSRCAATAAVPESFRSVAKRSAPGGNTTPTRFD